LHLARAAARVLQDGPEVRAETERWTPPLDSSRRDGVPARAYEVSRVVGQDELAPRDFDLGRNQGAAASSTPQPIGSIAALVTECDTVREWVTAGEAPAGCAVDCRARLGVRCSAQPSHRATGHALRAAESTGQLRTSAYPAPLRSSRRRAHDSAASCHGRH
jgi:hypothetical protein